ncbi:MAG: phosphoglucosamine mutase [Bacteroidales bacterium]
MTLIKSISGIRGTIGGEPGSGLTPNDITEITSGYARFIQSKSGRERIRILVGRDGRTSGEMVSRLVTGTLMAMGADVVDAGLSTTPTVEMGVPMLKCDGGIILTASHNPAEWNAMKLLNSDGEFLTADEGRKVLELAAAKPSYATWDKTGTITTDHSLIERHIQAILKHPLVDVGKVRNAGFKIAADTINSTGSIALKALFEALGITEYLLLNDTPDGRFAHNPEPLPAHLTELGKAVISFGADLGIAVDPDVDRLAFFTEKGEFFGEEYTLVAIADYVLSKRPGDTVTNLSSSRALRDITEKHGHKCHYAPVGEVNVVRVMKETGSVIGGEGNGGVICPELHYGRDALAGVALFLTLLAESGLKASEIRKQLPNYFMAKKKITLPESTDTAALIEKAATLFADAAVNRADGVKFDFEDSWVHLRRSNTEPVIRVYAEGKTMKAAEELAEKTIDAVKSMLG